MDIQERIQKSWKKYSTNPITSMIEIHGSGSNRRYFRIVSHRQAPIIACFSLDTDENKTFVYYSNAMQHLTVKIPKVLYFNPNDASIYFQEDLGETSLLTYVQGIKQPNKKIITYKQVVDALLQIQLDGAKNIDFKKSHTFYKWDKTVVLNDLFYCKNFFLDYLNVQYNSLKLSEDFFEFTSYFENEKLQSTWYHFMYRDFQARNIIITEDKKLGFIDFQGAMYGPIPYDIISLTFQAKANLSDNVKSNVLGYYKKQLSHKLQQNYNERSYDTLFSYCFLIRQLQLLGAYGFRGLIEKKQHFKESIYPLLKNLRSDKKKYLKPTLHLKEIHKIINIITSPNFIKQFKT